VTYTVVRNAPPPTFEQLGREGYCCDGCEDSVPTGTKIMPPAFDEGLEVIMDLNVGDAIDTEMRNVRQLTRVVRFYDAYNRTKHETYIMSPSAVRCRRHK